MRTNRVVDLEPFAIGFADAVLDELARRPERPRFVPSSGDEPGRYGADLARLRRLVVHGRYECDCRAPETPVNTVPSSMMRRDQSGAPWMVGLSGKAFRRRRHRWTSVRGAKHRGAAWDHTRHEGGRSRQDHPPVNTHTIAAHIARSLRGAVPARCGRARNEVGNGSTGSHSSSGTSRFDRRTYTMTRLVGSDGPIIVHNTLLVRAFGGLSVFSTDKPTEAAYERLRDRYDLVHVRRHDSGGHFGPMVRPDQVVADFRATSRSLR